MKYPLAVTNRLLEVYGPKIFVGYDIFCMFSKVVKKSAIGPIAVQKGLEGGVPSFHGHAHNRLCQVHWHPMYINGIGKEDLEGCERVFSASNALAPSTRLATPFHRQQAIEEHFKFWSADKYCETGEFRPVDSYDALTQTITANFIFNNYRQALGILQVGPANLRGIEARIGTCAADYERYLEEERLYLAELQKEPEETLKAVEYMEKLEKLREAE